MRTGACDICNAQNVEISFTVFAGLETWSCTDGCEKPKDETSGDPAHASTLENPTQIAALNPQRE